MAVPLAYAAAIAHSRFAARTLPRLDAAGCLLDPSAAITADVLRCHREAHWPGLSQRPQEQAIAGLREVRNSALLAIMVRDLSGQADLAENLSSISLLAEQAIQLAYEISVRGLAARHGTPRDQQGQPVDLLIVGMGKLGGLELNASSDVDLIYLVAGEGLTAGNEHGQGQIDLGSFFGKVAKKMSLLLAEPTAHGFVFRVDLRLRPNGDAGPVICSLAMLEDYLIVHGREWERYAWIKARVVNQPVFQTQDSFQAGVQALESIRRPFVFRRYLDFNALAALRETFTARSERRPNVEAADEGRGWLGSMSQSMSNSAAAAFARLNLWPNSFNSSVAVARRAFEIEAPGVSYRPWLSRAGSARRRSLNSRMPTHFGGAWSIGCSMRRMPRPICWVARRRPLQGRHPPWDAVMPETSSTRLRGISMR